MSKGPQGPTRWRGAEADRFRELWNAGYAVSDIAVAFRIDDRSVNRVRKALGLLTRYPWRGGGGPRGYKNPNVPRLPAP